MSERLAKHVGLLLAMTAAILSLTLLAGSQSALADPGSSASLSEASQPSTELRADISTALRDADQLKAGADYEADSLILLLDGSSKMNDGRSFGEYADAILEAKFREARGTTLEPKATTSQLSATSKKVSPTALAAPHAGENSLTRFGELDLLGAGNWLDGDIFATVKVPSNMTIEEAIRLLSADERVLSVSLNYLYEPDSSVIVENTVTSSYANDPSESVDSQHWHLDSAEVRGAWSYIKAQRDEMGESNVTVVVMDTGCDMDHPDLAANIDSENSLDTLTGEELLRDYESSSHGTHIAGIISAVVNNNLGVSGVSYNAKVLPINVYNPASGEMPEEQVISAFNYVFRLIDSGYDSIKVVNMSFTGLGTECGYADKLQKAADEYGLILVAAAGNKNTDAPAKPSDHPSCISVISIRSDDTRDFISNYGNAKDISAPGHLVYSTVDNGGYFSYPGTSQAAAVVSGAAAILYAADPNATNEEVRAALLNSATDIGAEGFDIYTANGKLNAESAVETLLFGADLTDVNVEEWYVADGWLTYVAANDLMSRYSGTTQFGPTHRMTRAQFATVLYRMANPNSQATTNPDYYEDDTTGFTDAVDGEYFTAALNWAKQVGIMTGDSSTNYTTVRPHDHLSRQEAAVMAQRFAGVAGASTSTAGMSTPDVNDWSTVYDWAKDAMKWCYHKGVINGWDNHDGTYSARPLANTERCMMAKIATVLHRDIMP